MTAPTTMTTAALISVIKSTTMGMTTDMIFLGLERIGIIILITIAVGMNGTFSDMLKRLCRFFKVFRPVHLGVGQLGLGQSEGASVNFVHKPVGVDE